jgi:hypothetical protein
MLVFLRGDAGRKFCFALNAELLTTFGEYDNNGAGFGADE